MEILEITEFRPEITKAINRLLPQLSGTSPELTAVNLKRIIESPASHLYMAGDGGSYYGMLTLVSYRIPTGLKVWIEDVVVADEARGRGVGRSLIRHAIDLAHEMGAKTLNLTSRPSRTAANRLYKKMGFTLRETNVYQYNIKRLDV